MGFQARGEAWLGQAERLVAEGWEVAWFDNRGVGETQAAPGRWTTRTMADDVVGLLDELGWERVHIVGVSMGGMIAQEVALHARLRGRLTSLTLVATHAGGRLNRLPTLEGLRRFALANGIRGKGGTTRVRDRLGVLFPVEWFDSLSDAERQHLLAELKRGFSGPTGKAPSPIQRLAQFSVILSHDTRDRLAELAGVATLVVAPGRDVLVRPRACRDLVGRIPGAQVLSLAEAGHGVLRQCQGEVNDALVGHLRAAELATEVAAA